jgi:predicted chitinase
MAEKVEIDIPGIGLIEAKNAATEATLLEILKVLEGTQKDNAKNAKAASKGAGGGSGPSKADAANMAAFNKEQQAAGKSFSILGAAAKGAGMAMNAVGKTAGIAVGGFNQMAKGAGMAAGATFTLGQKALSAGESMTSLIDQLANVGDSTVSAARALNNIPIVGGALAGIFGAVAAASENVVKSYQTAAGVGATFGGSVQDMSRAAGGAGMTLDQFAGLIKNNSESLMLLGGTTEEGAKQFSKLAKGIQQSDVGSELQRLGYSTEQINGGMARYIGMLGKTGALQGMSTQQLIASSGSYMKELDALAKITGVSREEKEKEQQALMRDAKVRAAMSGLDADQQKQMMSYITSFPKEQQGAIADMIATGNVTTEEAIKLQSMLPGVAQQTMQFGRTLQAGGKINQDTLNQAKNSAILEAKDSVKRNKARGLYDAEAGATYVAMADLAAQKVDGYSQAIGEQGKATEKANLAENLTKAKQRLAEFSNGFQMALANSGMLDTLMNVFQTLANFVMTTIVPIFNLFAQALTTMIPMITGFLTPAFKMLGEFVQDKIVPAFQILGAWVQDGLMPIFTRLWTIVTNAVDALSSMVSGVMGTTDVIEDIFEPALYAISDFIEDNLEPALATLAVVAIPAVVAKMATMAMSMLGTIANFIALNLPMIGFTIAVGALMYAFKKFGVDLGVVSDALKWAGSWISTIFLKLQYGIYSLLNKIPGMRGDFDSDLKGISEKMEQNEKDRGQLEEDMAARRQKNLEEEAKKENSRDERDKKRGERREQREKQAIDRKEKAELGAIGAKEDREKAAADAKDMKVDMSDPIQMLKTFAAKQKSAFTQEAKAIDDKEKSQSELTMASQEMIKAKEQADKASTEDEKKAARDRVKSAEERLTKATEANKQADSAVDKAVSRMKLAREGKDPGAVAEGKVKEEKKTEGGKPEASGKPTSDAKVPPINQDVQKNLEMVKAAMEKRGMNDPKYINATLANVMKETGGKVVEENLNYKNTSNDRIKSIFGSRAAGKSDAELNQIKSDPKQMGEMMYGSTTKIGKQMGNTEPGDGFKYRGRGNVQLTGKSNYAAASKAIYGDNRLVDNPDLVNDPAVAAEVTAWYMQKGQQGMAKSLGINTKNMSQDEANQLATSQIAGRAIKRGEKGYLGEEVLGKVDKFSKDAKIAGIAGAPTSEEAKKAIAEGKTKPVGGTVEDASKARADAASNDPRRTDKPATAEGKPSAGDVTPGSLQSLMKDGIVPTTLAFQDLVNKGIKPFQGMMSGVQTKTPLKGEVPTKESLSPGEELVKATAEAQAKIAQARDPGTGELLSTAKDLSKTLTVPSEDMNKTYESMASLSKQNQSWETTFFKTSQEKERGIYDSFTSGFDLVATNLSTNTKSIYGDFGEDLRAIQNEGVAKQSEATISESEARKSELEAIMNDGIARNGKEWDQIFDEYDQVVAKIKDVNDTNIGDYNNVLAEVKNQKVDIAAAETAKVEIVAQAEKEAADKIKAAEEAAQAEKDRMANQTTTMASSQEGSNTGANDLNTALAELIAISRKTADLNEKQLSVQSSLSGDLFA